MGVSAQEWSKLKTRVATLESSNKSLVKQNENLIEIVKAALAENKELREDTNFLRSQMNCANYHCDSIEQYGRRENGRLHEYPEKEGETEADVIAAVIERANYALSKNEHHKDTKLEPSDFQRAHRIGKKKDSSDSNSPPKPRKIIFRLKSYKLRQKLMFSKKHLKSHSTFKDSFFTEDLTPFRSKLLWYVKNHCNGKFVKVHTRDGNITAQLNDAQSDNDPWVTIKTPDDLFDHGIDVNLDILNEKYLRFEVHKNIDKTEIYNRFEQLLADVDVTT